MPLLTYAEGFYSYGIKKKVNNIPAGQLIEVFLDDLQRRGKLWIFGPGNTCKR